MNKINIRVEYESTPIRHCSIQCPNCEKWFWDYDCCEHRVNDSFDLTTFSFKCPICHEDIDSWKIGYKELNIEDCGYEKIKEDCMTRKEVWE